MFKCNKRMSESEKNSGGTTAPVVVMEQTTASRHKPIRPTEPQEEASDIHHKHFKVPVVEKQLKALSSQDVEDSDDAMSNDNKQQSIVKKFSSTTKKQEMIKAVPIEMETKQETIASLHHQPIPSNTETVVSQSSHPVEMKAVNLDKKGEDDSITEEVEELRTPEATKKHSDWSDDEEASGLPRSESRASRVSRAMRQLLCCGMRYEAASEDDVSPRPGYASGI